ncbi:hypothetical protein EJB05_15946, partial [Eragrostis curvula]
MERGGGSATAAAKKKNGKSGSARSGGVASRGPPPPPRSPEVVVPMDQVLTANDALRDALASLGATTPWYVTGKRLRTSDVHGNQARLLFSCKNGGGAPAAPSRHPLAACFTALEAARVADKDAGLLVTALDGRGRSHDIICKYLDSNHAYRFIAGWKAFVEANGLGLRGGGESAFGRDVRVEVWAFRSRKLHNRYVFVDDDGRDSGCPDDADDAPVGNGEGIDQLRADDSKIEKASTKKKKKTKKIREETGHPDGALGLVLLHYENNAAVEQGDVHAGEGEEGMVEEAPMTRQDYLGGAGGADEQSEATRAMSKDEMVAKFGEKMAFAAIGMNMLRMGRWGRD